MKKSKPKKRIGHVDSEAAVQPYEQNHSTPELKNSRFLSRQSADMTYGLKNMVELKDSDRLTSIHKQSDSMIIEGPNAYNLSSKTPPGSTNRLESISSVKGLTRAIRTSLSGKGDNKKLLLSGTTSPVGIETNNLYTS